MKGEVEWVKALVEILHQHLSGMDSSLSVVAGFRLTYAMEVQRYDDKGDPKMAPMPYQTDILVRESLDKGAWIPRVVIEAKYGSVTSHDAITYSQKATAHKGVHPFLRYGFLIGANKERSLPGRLLRHGSAFDFMLSWVDEEPSSAELADLVSLLHSEVEASRILESVVFNTRVKEKPRYSLLHRSLLVTATRESSLSELPIEHPDADIGSADWTKQTWDLPPYKSPEFLILFPDLKAFRELPVYKYAVRKGLIADDQWRGI